jgi:hypothetical protein
MFEFEAGALDVPVASPAPVTAHETEVTAEHEDASEHVELVFDLDDVLAAAGARPDPGSTEPTTEVVLLVDPCSVEPAMARQLPEPGNEVTIEAELPDQLRSELTAEAQVLDSSSTEPTMEAELPDQLRSELVTEAQVCDSGGTDALIELELPDLGRIELTAEAESVVPPSAAPAAEVEQPELNGTGIPSDVALSGPGTEPAPDTEPLECAAATLPAPADPALDDSGTLDGVVARIGALVESAASTDAGPHAPAIDLPDSVGPEPAAEYPGMLADERASTAHAQPVSQPASRVLAPTSPPAPESVPPAPESVPLAPEPTQFAPGTVAVDSTQTMRALASLDLPEGQSSQWFAIQLVLSEQQIDPAHVPNLGIFEEYRLYALAGLQEERVMHALRVGFFSSALAAEAVAGYLAAFFDSPCIKRVSVAERERFAESRVNALKDVGATGVHSVIELASPAPIARRAPAGTGGNRERRAREGASLWSRLTSTLKR